MTDTIYLVPCHYCEGPLDPFARTTYRRIIGWERKLGTRTSGAKAGSDITLREPRDEYACVECIDRLKAGVATAQNTLL